MMSLYEPKNVPSFLEKMLTAFLDLLRVQHRLQNVPLQLSLFELLSQLQDFLLLCA
jgi:hypothetical protein